MYTNGCTFAHVHAYALHIHVHMHISKPVNICTYTFLAYYKYAFVPRSFRFAVFSASETLTFVSTWFVLRMALMVVLSSTALYLLEPRTRVTVRLWCLNCSSCQEQYSE